MPKSTKQKEGPRQLIASDISYLYDSLCRSGNWKLNPRSFESSEFMPLDTVRFDADRGRYEVEEGSTATNDDVIAQAMVVCLLYRMEKGWGKARSFQALSVWCGAPAKADDVDDDFPLENLWREEIQGLIRDKRLGKTTLGHNDNYDNFPRLYACSKGRWSRRSSSYLGQVHLFAEQAAVQMALHLHQNVSENYAILAACVINYVLGNDEDRGGDRLLMYELSSTLLVSARKESDNFPKTAYDDILASGRQFEKGQNNSRTKRQRVS
ncbi:hypothetical protein ACHAWF_003352 [Thalassiosira exigua]